VIFATKSIDFIDSVITPIYINNLGLKNARQLTSVQKNDLSVVKRLLLSSIKNIEDLDEDYIMKCLNSSNYNYHLYNKMEESVNEFIRSSTTEPTTEELKLIESITWAKENNCG